MTAATLLIWTLEDELEALLGGEADDCLVCGEPVQTAKGLVACAACGSVLGAEGGEPPGQLALVEGRSR